LNYSTLRVLCIVQRCRAAPRSTPFIARQNPGSLLFMFLFEWGNYEPQEPNLDLSELESLFLLIQFPVQVSADSEPITYVRDSSSRQWLVAQSVPRAIGLGLFVGKLSYLLMRGKVIGGVPAPGGNLKS